MKEIIKECAEKICYLHGTLHPNDIIPDLKEMVASILEEKAKEIEAHIRWASCLNHDEADQSCVDCVARQSDESTLILAATIVRSSLTRPNK